MKIYQDLAKCMIYNIHRDYGKEAKLLVRNLLDIENP